MGCTDKFRWNDQEWVIRDKYDVCKAFYSHLGKLGLKTVGRWEDTSKTEWSAYKYDDFGGPTVTCFELFQIMQNQL